MSNIIKEISSMVKNRSDLVKLIKVSNKIHLLRALFSNSKRLAIYNLIRKEKLNITQIHKRVNLSYQNTTLHINKLKKYGLIEAIDSEESKIQEKIIVPAKDVSVKLVDELILLLTR